MVVRYCLLFLGECAYELLTQLGKRHLPQTPTAKTLIIWVKAWIITTAQRFYICLLLGPQGCAAWQVRPQDETAGTTASQPAAGFYVVVWNL